MEGELAKILVIRSRTDKNQAEPLNRCPKSRKKLGGVFGSWLNASQFSE
jgi:hypothetical protein